MLGGAASDTDEDGRVVSGVGGQYNFVAMAMEPPTRFGADAAKYQGLGLELYLGPWPTTTIPRHLRDVVISGTVLPS